MTFFFLKHEGLFFFSPSHFLKHKGRALDRKSVSDLSKGKNQSFVKWPKKKEIEIGRKEGKGSYVIDIYCIYEFVLFLE